ncbi:S-layer homology domain-containing protein [Metabacillus fastidiosus]|uniref:S-layer homology domain-containing protein n=1 Tax=Metabacillus fastidiosus TaxID=1458 RepID=UPI002E1BA112|nr:S-layer homology domain-containing protein [Metabacillus fastidiosus]
MKKQIAFFLAFLLFALVSPPFASAASPFKDVKLDHWAYTSIEWAYNKKIIKSYKDGTFKPDQNITEAEFIQMLLRFDCSPGKTITADNTSDNYEYLKKKNIPLSGYTDKKMRDKPLTKGEIARITAAFNGVDLTQIYAVQYMYVNDLSNGLTGKKDYKDFGPELNMTRSEAVALIQRLDKKKSCKLVGLEKTATGKDFNKYKLPKNFLEDETIEFPSPEEGNVPQVPTQPSNSREPEINVTKKSLIANGKDSTIIRVSLKDCNGQVIPYEESYAFRVSSQRGGIVDWEYTDWKYTDWKDYNFYPYTTGAINTDGPDLAVEVKAPQVRETVTDTISFQSLETNGRMACYRDPVKVELQYVPQAELQIELVSNSTSTMNGTNVLPADGNTTAQLVARIVRPGGEVISNFNGSVRFRSASGTNLTAQQVYFVNGVASTTLQSIKSNQLVTDDITAEIIQADWRYQAEIASVLDKVFHLEVVYEPVLQKDNSCPTVESELAFIIDSSGSMRVNDRERLRVSKTSDLLSTLGFKFNIASHFNSRGDLLGIGTADEVKLNLYKVGQSGGTNIAQGMKEAFDEFKGNGRKIAVLITDGKSNEQQVSRMLEEAKKQKVTIFTIGLGSQGSKSINESLLRQLAVETGGQYFKVEKNTNIAGAYQIILQHINCGVPVMSCISPDLLFSNPIVEMKNSNVYMNTYVSNACGQVDKVVVRFNSMDGDIDYELIDRGQNYYALKKGMYEISYYMLHKEAVFLAYDSSGNIMSQKRVLIK